MHACEAIPITTTEKKSTTSHTKWADEQVDDVELPAGRLGDDEDRLVAQKRAAKEVRACVRACTVTCEFGGGRERSSASGSIAWVVRGCKLQPS